MFGLDRLPDGAIPASWQLAPNSSGLSNPSPSSTSLLGTPARYAAFRTPLVVDEKISPGELANGLGAARP
jgi:hypothetical protein